MTHEPSFRVDLERAKRRCFDKKKKVSVGERSERERRGENKEERHLVCVVLL